GNSYTFTGRQVDEETGLYFYRARYYDPLKGRFLQRDPLRYADGLNLYEYARSNPIFYMDPTGLSIRSWVVGEVGTMLNDKLKDLTKTKYGTNTYWLQIDKLLADALNKLLTKVVIDAEADDVECIRQIELKGCSQSTRKDETCKCCQM